MHKKLPCVYIMANKKHGTIYTGVTSDLPRRSYEHRGGLIDGFAFKYNCKKLVYYEVYDDMNAAILREKQIKAGSRKAKLDLIEKMNVEWNDLYEKLF